MITAEIPFEYFSQILMEHSRWAKRQLYGSFIRPVQDCI
ncbi:hypothetical protein T4B_13537 [Trichinella pseudospiralis]|uniref:Uncharacterized protein n=1 Tax=Trichinella pseudospiralis TaxID=6337 RepID=A0A0V1GJB8_TRIPS|nr:hypothetical protein T4B_13537 [Trichinella pseudospiralis]KRZ02121.1 hypothetical protein T4C_1883 [Trichinella pseudospiralis]